MPRFLKITLIALAAAAALLAAVAAYLVATFDPNDHKALLVERVQKDYQRTLAIPGPIALTLFPRLGLKLGAVSLSERQGRDEFASLQTAQVSLAVWPLLRREVVVDRVAVSGLRAKVTRFKDGRLSIDDLTSRDAAAAPPAAAAPAAPPLRLDIAGIAITDAAFTFDDQQAPRRVTLTNASVEAGRVAPGLTVPLALKGRLDANAPALGADLALEGRLTLGPAPGRVVVDALKAEVAATLDGRPWKATLAGTFDGDTVAQRYALNGLALDAVLPHPRGGNVALAAKGGVSALLGEPGRVDAKLAGRFDESTFTLAVDLPRLTPPALRFDAEFDRLDLDRYRSPAAPAGAASAAAPDSPLDLSALRDLDASGQLRIGTLQALNLKAGAVRVGLRAAGGRLVFDPLAAELYAGRLAGRASVAATAAPRVALDAQLRGISIGPLLKDLTGEGRLEGRGDVTLDVTTAGRTVGAMTKALDGRAALRLQDGAVRGINVAQAIRQAKALLGGGGGGGTAGQGEATDFSELGASFTIAGGVAHNEDLDAKSPLLRVGGRGDIDLGAGRLDYLVKVTVVATLEGQGGAELQALRGQTVPVKLSGPFSAIDWKIDFGAIAKDAARQKLEDKLGGPLEDKAKEKGKALEQEAKRQLGDKLKGLLGK